MSATTSITCQNQPSSCSMGNVDGVGGMLQMGEPIELSVFLSEKIYYEELHIACSQHSVLA